MSTKSSAATSFVEQLVHRLVDRAAGEDADHLLVQRDHRAVVMALGDERKAVVFLPCDEPTVEGELLARALAARRRDADEVWNGLDPKHCHLVIVGARPDGDWSPGVRGHEPSLARPLAWHHLDTDGLLKSPADATLPELTAVLAKPTATHGALAPADWVAAERTGEASLGKLSRFRVALAGRGMPVTLSLVAAWLVLAVVEEFLGGHDSTPTLLRMGALSGRELFEGGEWWRVFSAAMLHGGPHHVLGNAYGALMFGVVLEPILGPARLLIAFAVSVAGGGLLSAWSIGDGISIGASGGVFGLMGVAIGLSVGARGLVPGPEARSLRTIGLFYVVLNGLYSLMPGVDWAAHLGGFLSGALLSASGMLTWRLPPVWATGAVGGGQWVARGLGVAAAALLLGSVGFAMQRGDAGELFWDVPVTRVTFPAGGRALSITLPRGAATRPGDDSPGDGFARKTWGRARYDPVTVSLIAWSLDAVPEDAKAYLEAEVQNFTPVVEGQGGEFQRVEVDGRPFLFRDEGDGGHPWKRWRGVIDHHLVDVLVSVMPEAREKWNGMPENVLRSIRSE